MLNPFTLWQLSFTTLHSTVKSLLDGHQWDPKKLSFREKCPVNRNSPPTNWVSLWKRYLLNGGVCYGRFHCISVWVIYMFLSEKIILQTRGFFDCVNCGANTGRESNQEFLIHQFYHRQLFPDELGNILKSNLGHSTGGQTNAEEN